MKIHIPDKDGQVHGLLRDIKTLQNKDLRLKISSIELSVGDNIYLDLTEEEIKRIWNATLPSDALALITASSSALKKDVS